MKPKYFDERLQAAFGEEMTISDYKECLEMLREMIMEFAKVAPLEFGAFYYETYLLPTERSKLKINTPTEDR